MIRVHRDPSFCIRACGRELSEKLVGALQRRLERVLEVVAIHREPTKFCEVYRVATVHYEVRVEVFGELESAGDSPFIMNRHELVVDAAVADLSVRYDDQNLMVTFDRAGTGWAYD